MERELLLEVERLVRELTDMRGHSHTAECGHECTGYQTCKASLQGVVECPKCKTAVPFQVDCDSRVDCGSECDATYDLDPWSDVDETLRSLELALVAIDMARERAKESAA